MPPLRTTISCRLFAPLLALAALLTGAGAAAAAQEAAVQPPAFPAAVKWSVALAGPPAEPPVIAGDQVYVALQSGVVVAHRVADGTEAWRHEMRAEAPLAADDGRLFVAYGGVVYAFNADGSPAWHTAVATPAAPMLAQDGWLIVGARESLSAIRASDGSVVWRQPIAGTSERPAVEGNSLFVPLGDGRVVALDLATGAQKWQRALGGAPTEVLAFQDHVFVGSADKSFYCLDADDGEVAWRQSVGAAVRGKPAADAERVYTVALDNLLRAFDRGNGALRWSPRGLPFRPTAGPVLLGEMITVAGTTSQILGFSATTGKPSGQLALPEALATLPAYTQASGVIRIAAATGNLNQTWTLSLAESTPTAPSASAPLFPPSR